MDRPHNLYQPVEGDFGPHGPFDDRAVAASPQFWASERRGWLVAAGAATALLGWVLARRR